MTITAALHFDPGGEVFTLPPAAPCRIGREDANDIVVGDPSASRFHAVIQRDGGGAFRIADLGSANGTTVNGRRVGGPVSLGDGDVIALGGRRMVFRQTAPKVAAPPPASPDRTQFILDRGLVTVLVVDVRGSTELARELGEMPFGRLMSEFFRIAGTLLDARDCWAQKYIGDAVMAVWREPGAAIDRGRFAALVALVDDLARLAATLTVSHGLNAPMRFGVGMHSGYASTGNMGGESGADFTAMGEAVSKAFRLEAGTRQLNCDVIVSEGLVRLVQPPVQVDLYTTPIRVELKGFDAPEPVYPFDFDALARLGTVLAAD